MTLAMRTLMLLLITALTSVAVSSSQSRATDVWQECFERLVADCAYIASHYGVGGASHYLAERYWRENKRAQALAFYHRAVAQGDGGAAYALARHVPAKTDQWLRAAAELGNREASLVVAEALLEQAPEQAYELLEPLAPSPRQRDLMALLLLRYPALSLEYNWHHMAPVGEQWQRRRAGAQWLAANSENECSVPVTIYIETTRKEVVFDWLGRLQSHPMAAMDFCFTLVSQADVDCHTEGDRAYCDAPTGSAEPYQWFVTNEGSANARPGQLFVSVDAEFSVLVHELAHWFGLADEYPMAADIAELFCAGRFRFDAQNIVVTHGSELTHAELEAFYQRLPWARQLEQEIALFDGEKFLLGSSEPAKVGLFPALTCQHTDYRAWKPVAKRTFMQQHENEYIPSLYLELMQSSEPRSFRGSPGS